MKSDFGSRLSRIEQVLVEISSDVRMLRTLTGLEPQSALNKIRYITEKVLVDVCRKHSVSWGPKEPTIESMVGPLVSNEILPRNQAVLVRTIQTNASAGSHYQESALTYTHVHIAQMALVDFLEWYCSERTSDLGLDVAPESVGSVVEGDVPAQREAPAAWGAADANVMDAEDRSQTALPKAERASPGGRSQRFWWGLAAAVVLVGSALAGLWWWSSGRESAAEFCLAEVTAGAQNLPDVGTYPDGRFLAAWVSKTPDGKGSRIVARISDDEGPVGQEMVLSTRDETLKAAPSVGILGDGRALVLWTDQAANGQGQALYGHWIGTDGRPAGGEFQFSDEPSGSASQLQSMAVLPDDKFVVVWQTDGRGTGSFAVVGQLFRADGSKLGEPWLVSPAQGQRQWFPRVAAQADTFLVVWEEGDKGSIDVKGRLFRSSGEPASDPLTINTTIPKDQRYPAVATVPGGYLVVWNNLSGAIWAQMLDLTGAKVGPESIINSKDAWAQIMARVSSNLEGTCLVVWVGGQDGSGTGVVGQLLGPSGTRLGSEFVLNPFTSGDQLVRTIGSLPDGRFVVAWESQGQDGDDFGVYARVLNLEEGK